jgi:hypothetical protein
MYMEGNMEGKRAGLWKGIGKGKVQVYRRE